MADGGRGCVGGGRLGTASYTSDVSGSSAITLDAVDHKKEVWRSRIVGRDDVAPTLLAAHPLNYRKHPKQQRGAVAQVLSDVGWVQEVIVSKRTGRVLDGHLRLELALEREEPTIPVKFVDLDEEEEARVLLSFDALGGMAQVDNGALDSLIAAAGDGGAVDARPELDRPRAHGVHAEDCDADL